MLSDQVAVAAISTAGGIIITFLTVKYKDSVVKKRVDKAPKDRMDSIFDGYERLIVQLTSDMERKESSIHRLATIVDELELELNKTKELLNETRAELKEAQTHKEDLAKQLEFMRKEYRGKIKKENKNDSTLT